MTIKEVPLTEMERKQLSRVLKLRVIFACVFLTPVIVGISYIAFESTMEIAHGVPDAMSFIGILISVLTAYLIYKYAVPFYQNTWRNVTSKTKLVIQTVINDISFSHTSKGTRCLVTTAYGTIDSWKVSILNQHLLYSDMVVNMPIELHCFKENKVDIICIARLPV